MIGPRRVVAFAITFGVLLLAVFASGVKPSDGNPPEPLQPLPSPDERCEQRVLLEHRASDGEPVRVIVVSCLGDLSVRLAIGANWFGLPRAIADRPPQLFVSGDQRIWLLGVYSQVFISDDGGKSFARLRPPHWGEGANYQIVKVSPDFGEVTLWIGHGLQPSVRTRVDQMRLGYAFYRDERWPERMRRTLECWSVHPPNATVQLVSRDGGRSWSQSVIDNGQTAATGWIDVNLPY